MATEVSIPLRLFSETESCVRSVFDELRSQLDLRQHQLLESISRLKAGYTERNRGHYEAYRELVSSKEELQGLCKLAKNNQSVTTMERSIGELEDKITKLRSEIPPLPSVEFCYELVPMECSIREFGSIEVDRRTRDYSQLLSSPTALIGQYGASSHQLMDPTDICVDRSSNLVYITDVLLARVQIWNTRGVYVNSFGKEYLRHPLSVAVCDRCLFVTDHFLSQILKFSLPDYSYAGETDNIGLIPKGIDSEDHELFVSASDSGQNLIYVVDTNLSGIREIGRGVLREFSGVRVSHGMVYALLMKDNCIVQFVSKTGEFIRNISINRESDSFQNSPFFCLDSNNNFVITDANRNSIKIIDTAGSQLGFITTESLKQYKPRGVATDSGNRIFVVFASGQSPVVVF